MPLFSKKISQTILFTLPLLIGLSTAAQAAPITFDLAWSNWDAGADMIGTMTVDDSLIAAVNASPGNWTFLMTDTRLYDLSLTVTGAYAGNGNFTLANFDSLVINTTAALDIAQNFIGQIGFQNFGFYAKAGGNAPTLKSPLSMTTQNGSGYSLFMTSMTAQQSNASVPEPATLALLTLGIVGFGMRRHSSQRGRYSLKPQVQLLQKP